MSKRVRAPGVMDDTIPVMITGSMGPERLQFTMRYLQRNVHPEVLRSTTRWLPWNCFRGTQTASLKLFYQKYYDHLRADWTCCNASGAYIAICRLLSEWVENTTALSVGEIREIFEEREEFDFERECWRCGLRLTKIIASSETSGRMPHSASDIEVDTFEPATAASLRFHPKAGEWPPLTITALLHGITLSREDLARSAQYLEHQLSDEVFHTYCGSLMRCTYNRLPAQFGGSLAAASLQLFQLRYFDEPTNSWTCWNAAGAYIAMCRLLKEWLESRTARSGQDLAELERISDELESQWRQNRGAR